MWQKAGYSNLIVEEQGVGPCFGLVPLGAAVGVVINHFLMNALNRRYTCPYLESTWCC